MSALTFPAPVHGSCSTDESNVELFLSPYLEPFDKREYKETHPEVVPENATESQRRSAHREYLRTMHTVAREHAFKYAELTLKAKQVCLSSCPAFDMCAMWVMSLDTPVYGVVAAMDESERARERVGTDDICDMSSDHLTGSLEASESRDVLRLLREDSSLRSSLEDMLLT